MKAKDKQTLMYYVLVILNNKGRLIQEGMQVLSFLQLFNYQEREWMESPLKRWRLEIRSYTG